MIDKHGISFYFGTASDGLYHPDDVRFNKNNFIVLQEKLGLHHVVFARQVHGTDSLILISGQSVDSSLILFNDTADSIITSVRGSGVGVLTADCLPLILHDVVHNAAAVVHAGWRGSVANILYHTIERMCALYRGASPACINMYIGPAIGSCCYAVDKTFYDHVVAGEQYAKHCFVVRDTQLFFDLISFNKKQAMRAGIVAEHISEMYHTCTRCNEAYHSYRRSGSNAGRQATIVMLK